MIIWKDFNDAEEPMSLGLIPKGTLVKTCLSIMPGGYDDETQGWTGGYATRSRQSEAVYLNCKFIIMAGEYAKRHLFHMIGLHSVKGPIWADMGRTFIKSLLNSAKGIQPSDESPQAKQARIIQSFADLEGLVCVLKVGVELDSQDHERNRVQAVITPDHPQYKTLMACGEIGQQSPLADMAQASWARR